MRLLIAGGAGYVGAALVPKLLERGYEVTVADLLWFGRQLPEEVEVRQLDVIQLTQKDLEGFDQVIFLAGLSNDPMAEFSPSMNFVSNGACPAYLSYIAKKAGVRRFIYAGSCSVYGYTVDELYDETRPTVSTYPYGISKLQGEQAAISLADDTFSVIALRKGTISGYSPRMRFDLAVNAMFRSAMCEGKIRVNNPSIWRPILSMKDAVSGYIRAVEASPSISGVFNLASGNYTIGALGDLVREGVEAALGRSIRMEILNVADLRNYKVSFEKAQHVLGFAPDQLVPGIVKELAAHIDEFRDFSNPRYYNIDTFKGLGLQARTH